jgi:dTDP-4-amino-4,6-dideoxygalactose transaminase
MTVQTATRSMIPFLDLTAMSREVGDKLDDVWREVTGSSTFVGGPLVETFERDWARYCGREAAVGVANGTDAIELILRALGVGEGDEVVVPTNTFVATAEAVVAAGAVPRFADVDGRTLMATPETVAAAITPRTAAVIVVDLFGNMPRMDELARLARARGLAFIEDAAQAHGATWHGTKAGSFGIAASFSFYPGKNLGAFGDAGAVVTDDRELEARIRCLADHGRSPTSKHEHPRVGRNSRLDALQAGVLSAKLRMLDDWNGRRRRAAQTYDRHLDPAIGRVDVEAGALSAHHLYVVRVPYRDRVRERLDDLGVRTGIHYPVPCHLQAPYRRFGPTRLPEAERAAKESLSLPMFPHIDDAQIRTVCDRMNEATGGSDAARS